MYDLPAETFISKSQRRLITILTCPRLLAYGTVGPLQIVDVCRLTLARGRFEPGYNFPDASLREVCAVHRFVPVDPSLYLDVKQRQAYPNPTQASTGGFLVKRAGPENLDTF